MDKKKVLMLGGVAVVVVGGYVLLKRHAAASSTATTTGLPSNNATVAAQTANPTLQLVNGNYSNQQGNFGVDSSSSYMQALAAEAALSGQLQKLQQTPAYGGPAKSATGGQ